TSTTLSPKNRTEALVLPFRGPMNGYGSTPCTVIPDGKLSFIVGVLSSEASPTLIADSTTVASPPGARIEGNILLERCHHGAFAADAAWAPQPTATSTASPAKSAPIGRVRPLVLLSRRLISCASGGDGDDGGGS